MPQFFPRTREWTVPAMAQTDANSDALDAHQTMTTQALNILDLHRRMLELLLGSFGLWEGRRDKGSAKT